MQPEVLLQTVGDLRRALAGFADDQPLHLTCEDACVGLDRIWKAERPKSPSEALTLHLA